MADRACCRVANLASHFDSVCVAQMRPSQTTAKQSDSITKSESGSHSSGGLLLQGKVALVTGAGSGIGRAASLLFAREGASVVVADLDKPTGEETVTLIKRAGGKAIFIKCDVSKSEQVEQMVDAAVQVYGRLDCCLNNAGIAQPPKRLHRVEEKEFNKVVDVNLRGVYLCMKYEIEQMLSQDDKSGTIVNVASVAGMTGNPGGSIYAASKSGVIALTETAAAEYGPTIRVNCLSPGGVDTKILQDSPDIKKHTMTRMAERSALKRLASPEEIAEVAAWLLSSRSSFVTGVVVPVDGGYLTL